MPPPRPANNGPGRSCRARRGVLTRPGHRSPPQCLARSHSMGGAGSAAPAPRRGPPAHGPYRARRRRSRSHGASLPGQRGQRAGSCRGGTKEPPPPCAREARAHAFPLPPPLRALPPQRVLDQRRARAPPPRLMGGASLPAGRQQSRAPRGRGRTEPIRRAKTTFSLSFDRAFFSPPAAPPPIGGSGPSPSWLGGQSGCAAGAATLSHLPSLPSASR